jgi:hypothetical protein
MHSDGGRPDDFPDLPLKRPVPPIMLQAVNGSDYVDLENLEEYDDGIPFDVPPKTQTH